MVIKSNMVEAHIFRRVENDIEFLLLKRTKNGSYPGLWQMVTGAIDKNEKAFETALREIKEETGLIPLRVWVVPNVNSFYSAHDDQLNLIPVFVSIVDSNSNVKISDEHTEYKWVNKDEAKKLLAWDGQRKSVELINQYFLNEKSFLDLVEIEFSA